MPFQIQKGGFRMKNQEQTAAEKPVICKVELLDFLMTLHSLVSSMTEVLMSSEGKGGEGDAAEKT